MQESGSIRYPLAVLKKPNATQDAAIIEESNIMCESIGDARDPSNSGRYLREDTKINSEYDTFKPNPRIKVEDMGKGRTRKL